MRFGTKSLLVIVAVAGAIAWAVRELSQEQYVVVSYDCGNSRRITIYAETFCDQRDIPVYEVRLGRRVVMPMQSTGLHFSCGSPISAGDLQLLTYEDGYLVAVLQKSTGAIALIHDFKSNKSYPADSDLKAELEDRLTAAQGRLRKG